MSSVPGGIPPTRFDEASARAAIERRLAAVVPVQSQGPVRLIEAQRYTLLLPAKRVRGILTLMTADAWGAPQASALDLACALEMIHAASLIVDDLPCMDDAALRRGARANHREHGEATAILAAFALMSEAFAVVAAAPELSAKQRLEATAALAAAIGPLGLTGGQQEDLEAAITSVEDVERVHRAKTGALFLAAAELGTIAAGIEGPRRIMMMDCGSCVGLAFQVFDDLIDVAGTVAAAGKDVRQDARRPNLAALIGIDAAARRAERHLATAIECLEASGARTESIAAYLAATGRTLRNTWSAKAMTAGGREGACHGRE